MRLEHDNPLHKNVITINWCMGNICNFSCSYCPTSLKDGSIAWYNYNDVISFCDKIIEHYQNKTVYFEFTGGEISLWKEFPKLCEYLKSKNAKVGFLSNGSASLEWWESIVNHCDHVCLSYHAEQGDEIHFTKVVKLTSKHFRTHVNIMMIPEKFNHLYDMASKITKIKNISIALQPLIKDFQTEMYEYSALQKHLLNNQHDLLSKNIVYDKDYESYRGSMVLIDNDDNRKTLSAQQLVSSKQNSWFDWKCSAGIEQMIIRTDGTIQRGWCNVGGEIGHILDKNLKLPTDCVICNKQYCSSIFDIMSSKEDQIK